MKKKNSLIRVTKTKYRLLAETAKENGVILDIKEFNEIKCFGCSHPLATAAIEDARIPTSGLYEYPSISLAKSFCIDQMKSSNRPEMDWSAIPADKIIDFILWHEIGHKLWNFCEFDVFLKLKNINQRLIYKVRKYNEVLADRFAWKKLFPEESLPIKSQINKSEIKEIKQGIEELSKHLILKLKAPKPLPAGRYKIVPLSMLENEYTLAFIGTEAIKPKYLK